MILRLLWNVQYALTHMTVTDALNSLANILSVAFVLSKYQTANVLCVGLLFKFKIFIYLTSMGLSCIKTKNTFPKEISKEVSKDIQNYHIYYEELLSTEIQKTSIRYKIKIMLMMLNIYETRLEPLQYNKAYYEKILRVHYLTYEDLNIALENIENMLKEYRTIASNVNNIELIKKVDRCLQMYS